MMDDQHEHGEESTEGIPLCVFNREPKQIDPDGPLAKGLDSPLATIGVFEARAPQGMRVIFAAETRQMAELPDDPEAGHAHIVIAPWQALGMYPSN